MQSGSAEVVLELGAKVARALRDADPSSLELLEEYSRSFDAWHLLWSSGDQESPVLDREFGEQIAQQHEVIVALTEKMLHSVERSLKDLRGWSKGIRAYIDHLPKQVSTMKIKEG